jgi:hypothetical protein
MLLRPVAAFFLSFGEEIKTTYFRLLLFISKRYPSEISME